MRSFMTYFLLKCGCIKPMYNNCTFQKNLFDFYCVIHQLALFNILHKCSYIKLNLAIHSVKLDDKSDEFN